jgi:hypothetical protein
MYLLLVVDVKIDCRKTRGVSSVCSECGDASSSRRCEGAYRVVRDRAATPKCDAYTRSAYSIRLTADTKALTDDVIISLWIPVPQ